MRPCTPPFSRHLGRGLVSGRSGHLAPGRRPSLSYSQPVCMCVRHMCVCVFLTYINDVYCYLGDGGCRGGMYFLG